MSTLTIPPQAIELFNQTRQAYNLAYDHIHVYVEPSIAFTVALFFLTVLITHIGSQKISFSDRVAGWWFLLNGVIIHMFLDGLVGYGGQVPVLYDQYCVLDGRYCRKEAVVMLVSLAELIIYGPLCIWTYWAIHHNKPYRHPLQLVISVVQICGTYMFALTEAYNGFHDTPADWKLEFTRQHLIYFWGLFICANLFWVVVPLAYVKQSWSKISRSIKQTSPGVNATQKKAVNGKPKTQ
jgi:cholestenol delta-isomerase